MFCNSEKSFQLFVRKPYGRPKQDIDDILIHKGWEILSILSSDELLRLTKEKLETKFDFHGQELDNILNDLRSIVYVQTTYCINIYKSTTIQEIKEKISKLSDESTRSMRFIYNGKELYDDRTIEYYNIDKDSTIFWFMRLRGD